MSEATVRAGIVALVTTAVGTGNGAIHNRQRYAPQLEEFMSLYLDTTADAVRAWTVSNGQELRRSTGLGTRRHTYQHVVRGYWSVDDAASSETVFRALVTTVLDQLCANRTLGGVLTQGELSKDNYPSLVTMHFIRKGKVLVHYAEIHVWCWEEVQM